MILAGDPLVPGGAVVLHRVHPEVPDILELRGAIRELLPGVASHPLPGTALVAWDADAERPWWVRRWLPGASLAARVRAEGPLPVTELVVVADRLAVALGQLHAAGVVHGSLRPGLVILGPTGPQLVDLELTLVEQRYGSLSDPRTDPWAAPEMAAGRAIGPQADVYGLGCLVAYAATGLQPGIGDPTIGMPPQMAGVVRRSLSPDPHDRPGVAEFIGWDLPGAQQPASSPAIAAPVPAPPHPALPGTTTGAPQPGAARSQRRWRAPLAAVAAFGVLALGLWVLLGRGAASPPAAAPTTTNDSPATRTGPPGDIVPAARVPIDATGRWTGSAAEVEGDAIYEMAVELGGDQESPRGTVTLTNIVTGATAAWEVSGRWRAKQLVLEPGAWLARPDATWERSVLTLVALSQGRLNGITSPSDDPGNPSANVDLFR